MNHVQTLKFVNVTPPATAVNNASATTVAVDTQGFRRCLFLVILGATDIALTALKVQESDAVTDANTLTSGTDVAGAVFGTSANSTGSTSTLPSATDDNKLFAIDLDCRGRKRYLDILPTIGNGSTGAYVTIIAILSRGESVPTTAVQRGLAQLLTV